MEGYDIVPPRGSTRQIALFFCQWIMLKWGCKDSVEAKCGCKAAVEKGGIVGSSATVEFRISQQK
jgi:hypothetical protein